MPARPPVLVRDSWRVDWSQVGAPGRRMMLRGMEERFDWKKPAKAYLALYEKMLPTAVVIEEPKPEEKPEKAQPVAAAPMTAEKAE